MGVTFASGNYILILVMMIRMVKMMIMIRMTRIRMIILMIAYLNSIQMGVTFDYQWFLFTFINED